MYNSSREEKNETNTICRYQTEGSAYSEFFVTTERRKKKRNEGQTFNLTSDYLNLTRIRKREIYDFVFF
jgi:hypothetical protein